MQESEIFVAWANEEEGSVTLSRRISTGQREPQASEQSLTVITSSVNRGNISVTFLRPKNLAGAAKISSGSSPLIWAWTLAAVEGGDDVSSQIAFHGDNHGSSGKSVSLLGEKGEESSSPNSAYLTAHVYLMIFAWCISMPIGIAVARFMKVCTFILIKGLSRSLVVPSSHCFHARRYSSRCNCCFGMCFGIHWFSMDRFRKVLKSRTSSCCLWSFDPCSLYYARFVLNS
jgi:hypothetical protein